MPNVAPGLAWILAAAFACLAVGSGIRLIALRDAAPDFARQRRNSLYVWWTLLALLSAAMLMGRLGLALICLVAGLLALREFQRIFQQHATAPTRLAWIVAGVGVAHYAMLWLTDWDWPMVGFPLITLALLTLSQVIRGESSGYVRAVGGYLWAAVLFFLALSYLVLLTRLPASNRAWDVGPMGWPLFVILLTEIDDIAQALVGRQFGQHRMLPTLSPGKTWEGFAGGCLITTLLSISVSPWLTSLTEGHSAGEGIAISMGAAMIISVAGLLGDVNMSAIKREAGVKDSSSMLPGMGGIIDRIDSLTFTAPAVYYYVELVLP